MSIQRIRNAAEVPSKDLADWGKPKTIGEPTCHLRGIQLIENPDGSEGGSGSARPGGSSSAPLRDVPW